MEVDCRILLDCLKDGRKVLHINLVNGQSQLWVDAVNFELLDDKVYLLPVRLSETSTICDLALADLNLHVQY